MYEFTYRNKENYIQLLKYTFFFILSYGVTIMYFTKEKTGFNYYIGGAFLLFCLFSSIPFLTSFLKVFFESIIVDDMSIKRKTLLRTLTIGWFEVQYFIRIPATGSTAGVTVHYELGDLKRKIVFKSNIENASKLVKFVQMRVGKTKKKPRKMR